MQYIIRLDKFFYLIAAKEKIYCEGTAAKWTKKSREGTPLIKRSPDLLPSLDWNGILCRNVQQLSHLSSSPPLSPTVPPNEGAPPHTITINSKYNSGLCRQWRDNILASGCCVATHFFWELSLRNVSEWESYCRDQGSAGNCFPQRKRFSIEIRAPRGIISRKESAFL